MTATTISATTPPQQPGSDTTTHETHLDGWVMVSPTGNHSPALAESLSRELNLPEAVARLLITRGFITPAAAKEFLQPSLDQLHDPGLMLGMSTAVARLRQALTLGEPVLIYGDYDVDGTVATVLLKTALERAAIMLNAPPADIRYHIPHRIREGYGMQETRIADAAAEGVRLVVSVDTGIRAFAAAEAAKQAGLDLIVTDHHLPDAARGVPEALAVINPNQPACPYPYKELCGAGVAFKLAQALLQNVVPEAERQRMQDKTLPSFLKLLAVATIADAVPLTGENRTIAAIGLKELRKPSQVGLRALMQLAEIDITRPIAASDVGFRLAPRINAAGRMDIASDVVEMFLTRDADAAKLLAEKLHRLNDERRATEAEALGSIEAQMDALAATEAGLPACLVLHDGETVRDEGDARLAWHRGVIGILASRVVDRTAKPALVITHEDGMAYGSGRSVKGFHLLNALTSINLTSPILTRFGGHAHAVGFALPSQSVPELRRRMVLYAAEDQKDAEAAIEVEYDAELRLGEITPDFLSALEQLGPFGMGNADPVFISRNVRLDRALKVVKDRHLRVSVEDGDDGIRFGGMAWSRRTNWAQLAEAEGWAQHDHMDIAYRLRQNLHPDFGGWELEIVCIRRCPPPLEASS